MKKFLAVVAVLFLSGCSTVEIPNYIQDKNPYKRTFYADFDETVKASRQALEELGWKVLTPYDPSVFEHNKETDAPEVKQLVLFTEIKQTPLIIASRYARVNIFVMSSGKKASEVEIRYLTATSIPFKVFRNYRNDRTADHIFEAIDEKLK